MLVMHRSGIHSTVRDKDKLLNEDTIRYTMRCYVRSKADKSQRNLPHGTKN